MPPRSGSSAAQAENASAAAAQSATTLDGKRGPLRADRRLCCFNTKFDPAVGREAGVVRRDEHRPAGGGVLDESAPELLLALRIHSSRRLVEDEQVGLPDLDCGEREPLPLAAREVAGVPSGRPAQPDPVEGRPRAGGIPCNCQGNLVERGLADEVPAGILREVEDAAAALDDSRVRLEQAGGELGERRLAGPVRAGEADDLAPAELEIDRREDRRPAAVGERDVAQAEELVRRRDRSLC